MLATDLSQIAEETSGRNERLSSAEEDGRGYKFKIGLEGEITYIFGVKGGIGLSFDTENLELGGSVWLAGTAGFSLGGSVPVSIERSDGGEAENNVDFGMAVVGDLSVGPVSAGLTFAELENGKFVEPSGSNGVAGYDLSNGAGEIKVKPALKFGASLGMQAEVEGTTTIVADSVRYLEAAFDSASVVMKDVFEATKELSQEKMREVEQILDEFNQEIDKFLSSAEPETGPENNNLPRND